MIVAVYHYRPISTVSTFLLTNLSNEQQVSLNSSGTLLKDWKKSKACWMDTVMLHAVNCSATDYLEPIVSVSNRNPLPRMLLQIQLLIYFPATCISSFWQTQTGTHFPRIHCTFFPCDFFRCSCCNFKTCANQLHFHCDYIEISAYHWHYLNFVFFFS